MPSLADLALDLSGWTLEAHAANRALYCNASDDAIAIHYHDGPPNIGATLDDVAGVRSFCRQAAVDSGGGVIDIDVIDVRGIRAVETIYKTPQKPSGMTYLGSITLPFASFSYVVMAHCREHGMTGLRDAIVFATLQVQVDQESGRAIGWMEDPYDPTFSAPVLRNRSDDPAWDEKFPDHPLSRCRRHLRFIRESVSLSDAVVAAPRFVGPMR